MPAIDAAQNSRVTQPSSLLPAEDHHHYHQTNNIVRNFSTILSDRISPADGSILSLKSLSKVHPVNSNDHISKSSHPQHNPSVKDNPPTSAIVPPPTETKKKQPSFGDRLLDALYFVCPDCSWIQCSGIFAGLLLVAILVVIFLYAGNYWSDIRTEAQ